MRRILAVAILAGTTLSLAAPAYAGLGCCEA